MHIDYLVRMANDIGRYFVVYPDQAEAEREVAGHLQKFWTPDMRASLREHLDRGGEGLDPLVVRAVRLLPEPAGAKA